jgi:hypothetical protein
MKEYAVAPIHTNGVALSTGDEVLLGVGPHGDDVQ